MRKNSILGTTIILAIFIIVNIYFVHVKKVNVKSGETLIFDIPGTESFRNHTDENYVEINKCYMILNPPEGFEELRILMDKFTNEQSYGLVDTDSIDKVVQYRFVFYRESIRLPRNWKPDDRYLSEDHIEHHYEDSIASVFWSEDDTVKKYYITRKSSNTENYGEILEEVRYRGDKVIDIF